MQLDSVGAVQVAITLDHTITTDVALRYICSLEVTASVGLLEKSSAKAR